MTERECIAAALAAALLSTNKDKLRDLASALATYRDRYPVSWQRIQRQPFCWSLVDAIYGPQQRGSFGTPLFWEETFH
jgi:hypothetical protein